MRLERSIEDRAWPAWVWSPQDRSIVAANSKARALWKLAPSTSVSGFLFPAKAKVTKRLHGAAIALLAGAEHVQIDIRLPFAKTENWQCRRIKDDDYPDGVLLLEAPQLVSEKGPGEEALAGIVRKHERENLWADDAFNALAVPIIMLAGDGNILHLNEEAQRLAPSDLITEAVGDLWTRPTQFRHFFPDEAEMERALEAIAEAHRTGSASFLASLNGVPGFPEGKCQVLIQRIGTEHQRAPLMVTFHKLAASHGAQTLGASAATTLPHPDAFDIARLHRELISLDIIAFEIDEEARVLFFTPAFAHWLDRAPQDVGGRRLSELGLTPVQGASVIRRSTEDWQDGRYLIRRSDGTIRTADLASIQLPSQRGLAASDHGLRLCIAKSADSELPEEHSGSGREVPEPVQQLSIEPTLQSIPRPVPKPQEVSFDLRSLGQTSGHDEDEVTGDKEGDNLVRLDDWRDGESMVLTGGSFQALIESLDVALLGLNEKGQVQFLNPAASNLLGIQPDDLRGTGLPDLFAEEGRQAIEGFLGNPEGRLGEQFFKGISIALRNKAVSTESVVLKLHALRERSPIRFCAFLRSEDPAKSKPISAPPPGAKPAQSVKYQETSGDKAKKKGKKQADFVARVSHEIRTPLNAILGFSDLILSESLGPIGNDKYKEYMKDIRDSGHLILSLVNDILDLAKAESQGLNVDLKGMNIETSMRRAASIMSAQAESKNINLSISVAHPLPAILADERSVMQILLNLVSNAIKFTQRGGEVQISAKPHGKDQVSLAVIDTGVGMSEDDLERAMSPYQQADSNSLVDDDGKPIGTGLGLPISKALAEANRAHFRIESRKNAGTRVEILFNRARAAAE